MIMARRTPQEIAEWREKMRNLANEISQMDETQRAEMEAQFGAIFTAEGRPLSAWNTCFLLKQAERPLAQVGGFEQWKKVGRQVQKGQHACGMIAVPMNGRKDEEKEDQPTKTRFKFVPMFAVDQTETLSL